MFRSDHFSFHCSLATLVAQPTKEPLGSALPVGHAHHSCTTTCPNT